MRLPNERASTSADRRVGRDQTRRAHTDCRVARAAPQKRVGSPEIVKEGHALLPNIAHSGLVESSHVRLPWTSTSCASAKRSGRKQKRTTENKSVLPLIFRKLMLDSLPRK